MELTNKKDFMPEAQQESDIFDILDEIEPESMHGQPKVVWDRAQGCYVFDPEGRRYIDFTSAVLVANAGHSHPRIINAIQDVLTKGLLTSYIFANEQRVRLIKRLLSTLPDNYEQAMLFCTGAEAVEAAIKLARNFSVSRSSGKKNIVVSFKGGFHGRTLGAQLAGGIDALKTWIGEGSHRNVNVPFPGVGEDFDEFLESLQRDEIEPEDISCVIMETYQGGTVNFAPQPYVKRLRTWCNEHQIKLIFDEIQSGFGRTGKLWGFEHYEVQPDLIVCGKGISSSLPISAVIGNREIMDQFSPGSFSTTHSGNPLCAAAAAENISIILEEKLVENASKRGEELKRRLDKILTAHPDMIKSFNGRGLVYGVHFRSSEIATRVVDACVERGLMLFYPVGQEQSTVKLNPPLPISSELVSKAMDIFESSLESIIPS